MKRLKGDKTLCPEGRLSSPTRRHDNGRAVVDITTYIPYFLSSVNNSLSLGASSEYLKRFNVGIADWRVISMLAIEPGIPAARIVEVISIDKGAASRSLNKLADLGLVEYEAMRSDPRRRIWELNAKGYDLHDRILAAALEREKKLITGADPEDLEAFLRVIRIMRKNVDRL